MTEIEQTPTIEQKWIPVREQKPKDGETVLITYSDEDKLFVATDYYSRATRCWTINHAWGDVRVLAWMPLPEPYKC